MGLIHCIVVRHAVAGFGVHPILEAAGAFFILVASSRGGGGLLPGGAVVLPYRKLGIVFYCWRGPMMNHSGYS